MLKVVPTLASRGEGRGESRGDWMVWEIKRGWMKKALTSQAVEATEMGIRGSRGEKGGVGRPTGKRAQRPKAGAWDISANVRTAWWAIREALGGRANSCTTWRVLGHFCAYVSRAFSPQQDQLAKLTYRKLKKLSWPLISLSSVPSLHPPFVPLSIRPAAGSRAWSLFSSPYALSPSAHPSGSIYRLYPQSGHFFLSPLLLS